MTKPKTTLAMNLLHQFLSATMSSGIDGAEMREAMEWVLERPNDATNPSEALTKVEKLKAEVEKLQQQLIAEAKKTAEEKLRADQLDRQHTMQSRMHREALRRSIPGGEWTCESCNGTGQYAPDGSASI